MRLHAGNLWVHSYCMNRFNKLCRTWLKCYWLLRKRQCIHDKKCIGGHQRCLSFISFFSCRERPLLTGNKNWIYLIMWMLSYYLQFYSTPGQLCGVLLHKLGGHSKQLSGNLPNSHGSHLWYEITQIRDVNSLAVHSQPSQHYKCCYYDICLIRIKPGNFSLDYIWNNCETAECWWLINLWLLLWRHFAGYLAIGILICTIVTVWLVLSDYKKITYFPLKSFKTLFM